ncbi:MAG: histidine phosphatase family protein, partial [Streptosporangiales bacterium]
MRRSLAVERARECLDEICAALPDGRVLMVTHTTLLRLVLCSLLGLPLAAYRSLFPLVRNCALTEIRISDDQRSLLQFNTPLPDGPDSGASE